MTSNCNFSETIEKKKRKRRKKKNRFKRRNIFPILDTRIFQSDRAIVYALDRFLFSFFSAKRRVDRLCSSRAAYTQFQREFRAFRSAKRSKVSTLLINATVKFCIIVPGMDVDYYKAWSDSRCSRKLTMRLTKNGRGCLNRWNFVEYTGEDP